MCKMSNYIHKMLLNTRGTASIVFLVKIFLDWRAIQIRWRISHGLKNVRQNFGDKPSFLGLLAPIFQTVSGEEPS